MSDNMLSNASFLAFNFVSSVVVIFVNKWLFVSFKFHFTTLLTAIHYLITLLGLELIAASGAYAKRASPTTPRLLVLSAVVGTAPALNNLSLSLNSLGFYQVVKLLTTPAIVGLEAGLYGATMSPARALSLAAICVGVGVACVNDVELNWAGCVAALSWLPVAAVYKVLWSRISKEEKWHTLALMRRVLPLSTVFLLALVPIIDPPGALAFHWTPRRVALVALSGLAAFFVNWSGFLVMGACSALSHTVLGQLKACLIIVGGYLFFDQAYPPKSLCGASVAIVSMVLYTRFNVLEAEAKQGGAAAPSGSGEASAQSEDDVEEGGPSSPLVKSSAPKA